MDPRKKWVTLLTDDTPRRTSARLATALVSARIPGLGLVTLGVVPALIAVLTHSAARPRQARRALTLAVLTVVSGAMLGAFIDRTSGIGDWSSETAFIGLWIISIPVMASAVHLAWQLPSGRTLLVVAALVGGVSNAIYFPLDVNPWKQAIGYNCSLLLLLAIQRRGAAHQVLGLLALFALGLLFDTRSTTLVAGLTLVTLVISRRRRSTITAALQIGAAVTSVVAILSLALGSGWLGAEQRDLYQQQTRSASNLISGARVEITITEGLASERAIGYGLGVRVAPEVQNRMIDRVRREGGDYTSDYFSNSVLGQRVDLHSTAANLWFHGGPFGLLLAVAVGWWLIVAMVGLSRVPQSWRPTAAFLMWMGMWDLLFSPMQQSDRVSLALGCAWVVITASKKVPNDSPVTRPDRRRTPVE